MGEEVVSSQNICLPTISTNSLQNHPKEVLIYIQMVFLEHTVSAHFQGIVAPHLLYVMILKPFGGLESPTQVIL